MVNIYFVLLQASLFSESGISKDMLMNELGISRGAIDNCFKKIPSNMLTIKNVRRSKLYSLDLERFDKIISNNN